MAYPSVADASVAEPGAPFGRPVRDALDCSLGIAERLGYEVTDDDGYVGIADIPGECEEHIATIAHVDVVPAGPGWGLGIAERLGYEVTDDDGYVGIADIPGECEEHIATIAHVDVVPAGPGWGTDPFSMERREGWLLGRGVIDDKGPAVLSLYAGAFFLREGITPRYTFRALLGCDEEMGMTDVKHYLAGHEHARLRRGDGHDRRQALPGRS